jgi:conjugal transfer pilin signal peptidase TrbI
MGALVANASERIAGPFTAQSAGASVAAPSRWRRRRAWLRLLRRGADRNRPALAMALGVFFYGQMALSAAAEHYTIAFDPQANRSLTEGVLFLIDHGDHDLTRGAIVAFVPPPGAAGLFPEPERVRFLKRVAGLPGDHVEIGGAATRVNGEIVGEGLDLVPYLKADRSFFVRSFTVPDGVFFAMGDTRDSFDGRYYGLVPLDSIIGRARRLL